MGANVTALSSVIIQDWLTFKFLSCANISVETVASNKSSLLQK
jgi:hypothetical protein